MVIPHPETGCTCPRPVQIAPYHLRRERVWSLDGLAPVLDQLVTEMALWGYPHRDTFAVRLALEEAIVNAIKHGHRGQAGKPVQVSYVVVEEWMLVEVEDQGPGFDPQRVPDPLAEENLEKPSGRGLFLMRCYMSWVRFFGRGNVVSMCRKRSHA
jgi:serine/threonine-protein kinase RsbW